MFKLNLIPHISNRFLCIFILAFTSPIWAKSPQEIFESAAPSIVVVESLNAANQPIFFGSGVVISPEEVVTNCHVVEKGSAFNVKQGGNRYTAIIHFANIERDLCQLSVYGLKAPPVMFGSVGDLKSGARVVAIGAPRGLELSISEGLVSSLRDIESGSKLIQTTAPISPGSSGGGLFNDAGQLIGITTLYLKDSQNLNFAVPVDWVWDLPFTEVGKHQQKPLNSKAEEEAKAIEELSELGIRLRANDPDYDAKLKYLNSFIESVVSTLPPSEWAAAVEKHYWEIAAGNTLRFLDRAVELQKSANWLGLLSHANDWAKAEPRNAVAWFYIALGRVGLRDDYVDSASALANKAQNTSDYNLKGMFMNEYDAQQAHAELENSYAIEAFRKAVELMPTFAFAWTGLGQSFKFAKNQVGAMAAYEKLKELDSDAAEKLYTYITLH